MEEAGVALVGVSYDARDGLAAFAKDVDITFLLLSDPDSEIIESFGILNTLVPEDDKLFYEMAFPGVYVTDADGVIQAKFFENNIALQPGVDLLIRAARGDDVSAEMAAAPRPPVEEVTVEVAFDGNPVQPGGVRELSVQLRVPEGQHLYGEPVPAGMVATAVEVDDQPGLLVLGAEAPATRPHTLTTGETLQIYEGDVTLRVRFTHTGDHPHARKDGSGTMPITGRVRYQSCDDECCGLPSTQPFEIAVPLARISGPRIGNAEEGEMDSLPYIQRMIERRS